VTFVASRERFVGGGCNLRGHINQRGAPPMSAHRFESIVTSRRARLALAVALVAASPLALVAAQAGEPVAQQVQVVNVTGTGCADVQESIDSVMVPLAGRMGAGATMDVTWRVEQGNVVQVEAHGGPAAYQRGLRRAVRGVDCSAAEDGPRRLRVLVVDAWGRLPS
jgi:hypothetical protein